MSAPEVCTQCLHATSARPTERKKFVARKPASAPFRVMGETLSRNQPVALSTDAAPTVTAASASALLRLLRELVEVQAKTDGPDDEAVVAS